ncbi:hypothetical protein Dimus_002717 [Dionaea muscipula]
MLSSDRIHEEIIAAKRREDGLRRAVAEAKDKHLEAAKNAEEAKMLQKEACERQKAQSKALQESSEKDKVVDELMNVNRCYRRYSPSEIEAATDSFSQSKLIGEGRSAKVYKGNIDRTPVAIKVLQQNSSYKKEEFLKEVYFSLLFKFSPFRKIHVSFYTNVFLQRSVKSLLSPLHFSQESYC